MLYSRRSWVALGVWLRYGVLRGRPHKTPTELLADWMESPGTKAYTQAELDTLFAGFSGVRYERFVTPYDRRVGGPTGGAAPVSVRLVRRHHREAMLRRDALPRLS